MAVFRLRKGAHHGDFEIVPAAPKRRAVAPGQQVARADEGTGKLVAHLLLRNRRCRDDQQQRDADRDDAADDHLVDGRDGQQGNVALHDAEYGQQQREDDGARFEELEDGHGGLSED